ncbi:hypothetical protein ACFPVX_17470 [Cohnella faecalis]|uniref:Phage tail protein n=1 Tax=Cohnella faecalis TaxID=2315694 RepID=A0A398CKU0_9BACL|nr:hypothetical protein [Cohnella faecalis]RIE01498.1 hypothetical protein D3H35_24400 [Cohnella faecalis]
MKETFIVKHAVGGEIYIDTAKRAVDYRVEPAGAGWTFTVHSPLVPELEEILRMKDELNVFIFREYDDRPTVKTWYYVGDGPVKYDPERGELTIAASSHIEYVPDSYQS